MSQIAVSYPFPFHGLARAGIHSFVDKGISLVQIGLQHDWLSGLGAQSKSLVGQVSTFMENTDCSFVSFSILWAGTSWYAQFCGQGHITGANGPSARLVVRIGRTIQVI